MGDERARAEAITSADAMGDEERMLRDALGDELSGALRMIGRDPYGEGALTGFEEASTPPRHWYVDTSGGRVEAETGLVLGDPAHPVARIWLHPADPRLPALAPASFADAAATLMARLGVRLDRAPELVVYRPGKRAMFRMRAGDRETYLKIVRPAAAAGIVALQESLRAGDVPVPHITGWSELGIVLTETARGVPLTDHLGGVDAERLLDAIEVLRARMAAVDTGRVARASLGARRDWYRTRMRGAVERARAVSARPGATADTAAGATADTAAGVQRLAIALARIDDVVAAGGVEDAHDEVTVHGDLHIGQLFVDPDDPSSVTGVIDIDTAGTGDPCDDEAALLGHLVASIALARADAARERDLRRLLDAAAARWLRSDRSVTARTADRTAVHVLAHALLPAERGDIETAAVLLELGGKLLPAPRTLAPSTGANRRRLG